MKHRKIKSLVVKLLILVAIESIIFLILGELITHNIIDYVPQVVLLFVGFGIAVAYSYMIDSSSKRNYRELKSELGDLKADVDILKSRVLGESMNDKNTKK